MRKPEAQVDVALSLKLSGHRQQAVPSFDRVENALIVCHATKLL
jgi:hypothetical protein